MKTILKYESRIQEIIVGLLLFLIIPLIIVDKDIIFTLLLIEFFLIAIFQYFINLIKFFQKKYPRTIYRRVYVALSTYVVVGFLTSIVFSVYDLIEIMAISWTVMAPILIIQSLLISYSDKNLNNEKPNI